MHYSILLLSVLATLVAAQNPFSFTGATLPDTIPVGTPFNITWSPSTGTVDTVTLILRQGDPNALVTVETIASGIQNTGSYLWTPTSSIVNGPLYAFEIVDDGNTSIVNYSGQFAISSPNTISSALPSSTSSTGSQSSVPATATGTPVSTASSTTTTKHSSTAGSSTSRSASGTSITSTSTSTSTSGTAAPSENINSGVNIAKAGSWVSGGLLIIVGAIMVNM